MSDSALMFGAPAGIRASEEDTLRQFTGAAQIQNLLSEIASRPSVARLHDAQAGKLEEELANERRMGELMRRRLGGAASGASTGDVLGGNDGLAMPPQGKAGNMAETFAAFASDAMAAGMPTKAEKLAGVASKLAMQEASTVRAYASAATNAAREAGMQARLIGQIFGGAKDQTTWDHANALFEATTRQRSPYAGVPFSPALIDTINQESVTAGERAQLAERRLSREAVQRWRGIVKSIRETANDIGKKRNEIAEGREARLERNGGGKAVSPPGASLTKPAEALLKNDFGEGMSAADRKEAGFAVAAAAQRLMRMNRALDAPTALAQAMQTAKASGDFPMTPGGILGKDKVGFAGRGKSADIPLPLPKNPKDPSSYIKDRWYDNGKGAVSRWTGSGFAGAERSLSGHNGRVDSGDDTGDETDDEEGDE